MAIRLVWLIGEIIVVHNFSADEAFEWERSEHVQAEAETRDLHYEMTLSREVVEDVAFRAVSED